MGRSIFFKKNLRLQFDVVFRSDSNDGIFDSLVPFFILPIETKKNLQKFFCVGCRCRTNFKFSNRHNSPPNGAGESKIPSVDSEWKTASNCVLRFFSEKIDLPTLFSFYQYSFHPFLLFCMSQKDFNKNSFSQQKLTQYNQ